MDHMTSSGGCEGSLRSLPSAWVGADEKIPRVLQAHELCECLRSSSCSGFFCFFFSLAVLPIVQILHSKGNNRN